MVRKIGKLPSVAREHKDFCEALNAYAEYIARAAACRNETATHTVCDCTTDVLDNDSD